jgi:uncharacterized membrane protein
MGDRRTRVVAECIAMASGAIVATAGIAFEFIHLPSWAPNLHPLIVHFPIAWLIAALVVDVVSLVLPRATWTDTTAACLYPAGALSAFAAYLTGRQAAAGVLVPGMAQPIVQDHWNWAIATTLYFSAFAVVRLALTLRRRRLSFWARTAAIAVGLGGMLLLFHTAEQGARLVYEHGVGVAPRGQYGTVPSAR